MFTFRLSSYQFIQYLLIIYVSSGVIAKQTPTKCAAVNEYCLNHWDCCSNVCLSYLYRCTRERGVYLYPPLGFSYKPIVSLEQIYAQNFGNPDPIPKYQVDASQYLGSRFGAEEDLPATEEIHIVLQNSDKTSSGLPNLENLFDLKETTVINENLLEETTLKNTLDQLNLKETSVVNENLLEEATLKNSMDSEKTATVTENLLIESQTEAQTDGRLETTQTEIKRSTETPRCAEIGEKCYRSDECCDKLCHGYLHQCVT